MSGEVVSHVSDTARWVAVYRAIESERPDAVFRDPFADRLAGPRGRQIAAKIPRSMRSGWWMVARTKIIDDLIADAIASGCDRVLNLAAGLDTRPYRLELPDELTWVEADLPGLLTEKEHLLDGETPRCRLIRVPVDLADPEARDRFLDEALVGASKALVLTEGLLMYLEPADVDDLTRALTRPQVAWWVLDLTGPGLKRMMNEKLGGLLANTPFKFAPEQGVRYFEERGWRATDIEPHIVAAARLRRLPWFLRVLAALPQPDPHHPPLKRPWNAVVRLTRSDSFSPGGSGSGGD